MLNTNDIKALIIGVAGSIIANNLTQPTTNIVVLLLTIVLTTISVVLAIANKN